MASMASMIVGGLLGMEGQLCPSTASVSEESRRTWPLVTSPGRIALKMDLLLAVVKFQSLRKISKLQAPGFCSTKSGNWLGTFGAQR
jgi:hypothetical protein